ncbi:ERCC4 domain-containing protein [Nitrososphaera viennensis]|uniref:Helix-hairpin-helix domain-containing protein n=2 Tax=Nitrososphaera viennensis TaxID=1034015 RepID=A0A977IEC2_9ARCH|nr:ERCC4 domain-containing protein [Nitrososphaera viennensis]AIC14213.1 putative DNA repair nuclease XPF [Nitrososphaera viennensis EN76]UVS69210.1 helix-hairpin-helix domain-containing protein [Nitrososphaera viennensis]
MPARIVVDERERPSGIPDILRRSGVVVDFAQLIVGDYIVSPDTAVERKTVHDLIHSIYDGRLYVQCAQLVKHYQKPIVIIQGDLTKLAEIPEDIEEEKKKKMAERLPLAFDALATVAMEFRIPVLHAPDAEHTAVLLGTLAAKGLQNGGIASGPLLKKIRKENPVYLQQLYVLSSVPGVGDKLAARMLEKFKTPQRALNASAAELATIPGFGLARAQRLRKILDSAAKTDSVIQKTLFEGQ